MAPQFTVILVFISLLDYVNTEYKSTCPSSIPNCSERNTCTSCHSTCQYCQCKCSNREQWSNWVYGTTSTVDYTVLFSISTPSHITKICVRDSSFVDKIAVWFANGDYNGPVGGSSSNKTCDEVQDDECYTSINLRVGAQIDSLEMVTSLGRKTISWGGKGGSADSISGDGCISRLEFRLEDLSAISESDLITGIRAYFESSFCSERDCMTCANHMDTIDVLYSDGTGYCIPSGAPDPTSIPTVKPTISSPSIYRNSTEYVEQSTLDRQEEITSTLDRFPNKLTHRQQEITSKHNGDLRIGIVIIIVIVGVVCCGIICVLFYFLMYIMVIWVNKIRNKRTKMEEVVVIIKQQKPEELVSVKEIAEDSDSDIYSNTQTRDKQTGRV